MTIDLNADLGESLGAWSMGDDETLLSLVSSANIACGFHAGDPVIMRRTVEAAAARGVAIGAHPGYPDLQGFGRRSMALSPGEMRDAVLYQAGALAAFARAAGSRLAHLKPHGALYNDAARDPSLARAVALACAECGDGVALFGPPGSALEDAARALGLRFVREFFADRAYRDDGSLVPRAAAGATIHDPEACVRRTLAMIELGSVESAGGAAVPMRADTVCLHGDHPGAVAMARALSAALASRGMAVAPPARR